MSLESVFKLSLIMNMVDHLSGPLAGIASRVGADVSKLDALGQSFAGVAKAGMAMQAAGTQILGAVLSPVEATFETRRALGELASLGVQDLNVLESAARSFSDQWSGTTKADFISAAYDIKSGISSLSDEGVAEFTSLAALTAKATKSSAAEMTSLFATGYGIYKDYYDDLSDIQFGEMFSAGISESVRAFKTSGSGMAQAVQSLGASATTANVPLEEQLTILGMLQATMGGSEAGTKYKAFLRSATKGGEALGLSFTDANNQLLSMPEILDLLRGKFGDTMDAAEKMELQQAFGDTEAVALIDLMYNKVGDLQDNILGMYDALGSGSGAARQMASAIQETEPERYARLKQQIHNIMESIGNSLLPVLNELLSKAEVIFAKVGTWIEQNQGLVKTIMMIVLGLGGFLTVAGTVLTVIGGVGMVITKAVAAFKILKAGFVMAKAALLPLTSSVWSFTAALLANPITWIVIAIIAVIAALVLLYNKCEWFRNAVNAILNFFKERLGAVFEVVKTVFGAIGNFIGKVMGAAKTVVQENLSNMKRAYEEHGGGIKGAAAALMEGIKGNFTAGYRFLNKLTGGKLDELKNAAAQKLSELKGVYEAHGGGIKGVMAAAWEGIKGLSSRNFEILNKLTGGKLGELKDKIVGHFTNMVRSSAERFGAIRNAIANVFNRIKERITGTAAWFYESGKRIITTFSDGIKSAFGKVVDTVRGGLQKVRNLLPFSDAREGPLSTLTLSGQRTMTTYAYGLHLAEDAPAEAVEAGLRGARSALEREPPPPIRIGGTQDGSADPEQDGRSSGSSARQFVIQKLIMQVDLKKLRDLQQLLALLQEVEDIANSSGDAAGEPDTAFTVV